MARALCFTCGEKWGHQHKCGQTVQLHVVEELLQMLQSEEPVETSVANVTEDCESDTDELHAISDHALKGLEGNHTLILKGKFRGLK